LKEITLSFYTVVSSINSESETERLKAFCERTNPRLSKMETKLTLRKVIFDEVNEDTLMAAGMITLKSEGLNETSIEELLGLELEFEKSDSNEFPTRIYKDVSGNVYRTIPDNLIMQAVLQVAFGAVFEDVCDGDCSNCASGCDVE